MIYFGSFLPDESIENMIFQSSSISLLMQLEKKFEFILVIMGSVVYAEELGYSLNGAFIRTD